MAASIVELHPKSDRLRSDQAERLRQALLPFEAECPGQVRDLIGHIDRQTASRNKWTFIMLSPSQNAAVVRYLRLNSKRPMQAMELWAMCFEHLRNDTGEILLTRKEMAEKLDIDADNVSHIMAELVAVKAIITRREPVKGIKGPGTTRYFMNPRVATHLGGNSRDQAQEAAPQLVLNLSEYR